MFACGYVACMRMVLLYSLYSLCSLHNLHSLHSLHPTELSRELCTLHWSVSTCTQVASSGHWQPLGLCNQIYQNDDCVMLGSGIEQPLSKRS